MTDFRAMPFDGRICPIKDEAAEALRRRQTEARIERHRERLLSEHQPEERAQHGTEL